MKVRMTLAAAAVAVAAAFGMGMTNTAEAGGCYGGYCHTPVIVQRPIHYGYDYYTPRVLIRTDCYGRHFFINNYGVNQFLQCDHLGRYYFFQNHNRCYVNNYSLLGY
ncbi:MAG: hypothetical protein KDA80_21995 [Planctomycetaceae bacterium]|nr:hypothetical protein [Planctomycetaceae bacterium]